MTGAAASEKPGRAPARSVEVLTVGGLVRYLVFFVIDLKTRRVHIAGIAPAPDGAWMAQVARNLTDAVAGPLRGFGHMIVDRDPLYTAQFQDHLPPPEAWRSAQFLREKGRVNARFEFWDTTGRPGIGDGIAPGSLVRLMCRPFQGATFSDLRTTWGVEARRPGGAIRMGVAKSGGSVASYGGFEGPPSSHATGRLRACVPQGDSNCLFERRERSIETPA